MRLRPIFALASALVLAAGCASNHDSAPPSQGEDGGSPDGSNSDGGPGDDPTSHWKAGDGPLAPVSGKVFMFGPTNGETLDGAKVSVAEAPSFQTTLAADGTFAFEVPSGAPLSFTVEQPSFHPNQSATLPMDPVGVEMLGFQMPTESTFNLLATVANLQPDPARCQIVTTVSRAGTEPYGGAGLGEPDVVVSVDPPLQSDSGPIYFQYLSDTVIVPDSTLKATSIDGGVIIANAPPGEYTLTATKPGKQFSTVRIRCRAGVLVNAAPPHGLQEL